LLKETTGAFDERYKLTITSICIQSNLNSSHSLGIW